MESGLKQKARIDVTMEINGYKTYIIGGVVLIAAIVGKVLGAIDGATAAEMISLALLAMGIRSGIKKAE